jgi:hypothetical protein
MDIGTLLYDGEAVMAPQADTSSGKLEPVWCYCLRDGLSRRGWWSHSAVSVSVSIVVLHINDNG